MGPKDFVTSRDGTQIWTDAVGDHSKPSIVFVNGFISSALVFEKQFEDPELINRLHLVRYDRRGQGLSSPPPNSRLYTAWTPEKHAEDFQAVVDRYGLKKPFIAVWGESDTTVADITAHLGPDCYSGVVFLSSTPFPSWNKEVLTPWRKDIISRLEASNVFGASSIMREFVRAFTYDPENVDRRTQFSWIGGFVSHEVVTKPSSLFSEEPLRKAAKAGKVSALVLLGKDNMCLESEKVEGLYKETFKSVEVHIWPKVGHLQCFEEPEMTRNAILAFVEKVAPRSLPG